MTYNAIAEWDGFNWVAEIKGMPGAFTQAKRLDLLPGRLTEVVKLVTGKKVAERAIDLEVKCEGDGAEIANEVKGLREELQRIEDALRQKTPIAVRRLHDRGMTMRDIGNLTGVSYQRVSQLLGGAEPASRHRR